MKKRINRKGRQERVGASLLARPKKRAGVEACPYNLCVLCALCGVIFLAVVGCRKGEEAEEVVAVVNEEEITKAHLVEAVVKRYGNMTLNELIVEKLIQQGAAVQGVSLTLEEKDTAFAREVALAGGEVNFWRLLAARGTSEEAFKEGLYTQVLLRKLAGKGLVVTDEQVQERFERRYGQRRTLQEIFVKKAKPAESPSEEELPAEQEQEVKVEAEELPPEWEREAKAQAEEIRKELEAGADFTRIAVTRTEPLQARARGGVLFEVPRGILLAKLQEAVFSLKEGEISRVLESEEGYHIFRVLAIIPAQEVKLEDKEESLREEIKRERAALVAREFVQRLQEEGKIERR